MSSYFVGKNKMKNRLHIIFLILLGSSCNSPLDTQESGEEPPFVPYVRGSLYAAAVVYPDGYDWRRDSIGAVPEIRFFKDSTLLFASRCSPAGNGLEKDADMHRIRGNHLYSDYCSDDGFTHIAMDSVELFRYEGREMVIDVLEDKGDVYTLGLARTGQGWSFRENGELVCGRDSGEAVGRLHRDGHSICFAYSFPDTSAPGSGRKRYFLVSDRSETRIELPEGISDIRDVRSWGGTVNVLACNGGRVVWICGGESHRLDLDGGLGAGECRFIVAGDSLVAAVTLCTGMSKRTGFWTADGWKRLLATENSSSLEICSLCNDAPALCFAESLNGGCSLKKIHYNMKEHRMGGNFLIFSPHALCCDKESFAAGLNDGNDNLRPFIIRGRDTVRYDFNGYFIHLALP